MDITRLNSVPPELRRGTRIVCWRMEQVREGVWVKIPVDVHTGKDATCDNPATWATWDAALAFYQAYSNTVMGIGRMIVGSNVLDTEGRVLAARDNPTMMVAEFAGCLDEQRHLLRDHPAARWVREFDSYTEVSPDASAVIVWVYAVHDLGGRAQRTQHLGDGKAITIYREHAFLPLTGQRLTERSRIVEHRQSVVNGLYQTVFGAEDARHSKPIAPLWQRPRPSFTTVPAPARNPTPINAPSPARASMPLKIDMAKDFLQTTLRSGAVEHARIIAAAKGRGFSVRTLRRAKRVLRVRSTRRTFQGPVVWKREQ